MNWYFCHYFCQHFRILCQYFLQHEHEQLSGSGSLKEKALLKNNHINQVEWYAACLSCKQSWLCKQETVATPGSPWRTWCAVASGCRRFPPPCVSSGLYRPPAADPGPGPSANTLSVTSCSVLEGISDALFSLFWGAIHAITVNTLSSSN